MKTGELLMNFVLPAHDETKVEFKPGGGKLILLSFHPLAWTSVCARQMKNLEKAYAKLARMGITPYGVSVDPVPSKKAWAKKLGLRKMMLLSDFWPHGDVASQLGIFREKNGFSERANILIDRNFNMAWIRIYRLDELPDMAELLAECGRVARGGMR